jgi:protein-S-isoprenylcysteine O-methyltransferase Ste14
MDFLLFGAIVVSIALGMQFGNVVGWMFIGVVLMIVGLVSLMRKKKV